MRDDHWFGARSDGPVALTINDRWEALTTAKAFHEGDSEALIVLLEAVEDPLRLIAALMDLVGTFVYELAAEIEGDEAFVWKTLFEHLENGQHGEFVRKANR